MTPVAADQTAVSRRHRVLGVVALATLAGSIWALDDGSEALPAPRAVASSVKLAAVARSGTASDVARAAAEDTPAPLALPERYGFAVARRDLFAGAVRAPAPAAVVVAVAASAALPLAAPPALTLPFSYAGRLVTADRTSVLLNDGSSTRVLAVGSTLGEFRFERDGAQQLEFIHVPSGERLLLALQP